MFTQVPHDAYMDYNDLVAALEGRYKKRWTIASYLAELENRKLGQKEILTEYVCDIKRFDD